MIDIQYKKFSGEYKVDCESCGVGILKDYTFIELYFRDIHQTIHICEECGYDLRKSLDEELQ